MKFLIVIPDGIFASPTYPKTIFTKPLLDNMVVIAPINAQQH